MAEESTALIVRESLDPEIVFTDKGMDELLQRIRSEAMSFVFDAATEDGRKAIASIGYKVARSKTIIDDMGKDIVAGWKAKSKVYDAQRKKARDYLDGLKEEVLQPKTDYDNEQKRIVEEAQRVKDEQIQSRIDQLAAYNIIVQWSYAEAIPDEDFAIKLSKAKADYEAEQQRMAEEEAARKAESERLEKERAELEAMRAEQEKIRKEQTEKDRVEREKMAEEARKLEAEREAIRLETERIDREKFEAEAKERARVQAEKDAKEKAEREAFLQAEAERKAAEDQARQEALAPDQEKLKMFAENISSLIIIGINNANLKSDAARSLFKEVVDRIDKIRIRFLEKIDEL